MAKKRLSAVMVLVAAAVLGGGAAQAAQRLMEVTVPFDFMVEGQVMAAGSYTVVIDGADGNEVVLQSARSGEVTELAVVTRLADVGREKAYLVFDTVGEGERILSEIHAPGMDGFALPGAGRPHGHETVPSGN